MSRDHPLANPTQSLTNEVESLYSAIIRAYKVTYSERLQGGGRGWAFGFHATTEHRLYVNPEARKAYLDLRLQDLQGINIPSAKLSDADNCKRSAIKLDGLIEEQLSELWGVSRDSFSVTTDVESGSNHRLQIELSDLITNPDKQRAIVCALKHTNLEKIPVNYQSKD